MFHVKHYVLREAFSFLFHVKHFIADSLPLFHVKHFVPCFSLIFPTCAITIDILNQKRYNKYTF